MKKSYLFLAAIASIALVSCSDEEFVGDPELRPNQGTNSITFASLGKSLTRADVYGADAAKKLGNKFVVTGVKGDGTWTANQTDVFKSYSVEWTENTAGKTESNTSDWEYVGVTPISGVTGVNIQTIKYWDYSNAAYNFAAYSLGEGATTTGVSPTTSYATGTAIDIDDKTTANTGAYTLAGNRAELSTCYITDMITVAKTNYKQEVQLKFRSLATKVRMALYETVPGYSVKEVKFYSTDQSSTITTFASSTDATLFGTNAFREAGTFTVKFPTIGSGNSADKDYNKAHVTFEAASSGTTASSTQGFGGLIYGGGVERYEASDDYLQRSSINPSFAGSGTYYQVMLPNEEGVVLEMCVDYTLVSIDGSGEEIKVRGAKAFVPAVYTKWLPNYAYTYIFKISDNTNGWTNPDGTDPAGLFPITFDAVVLNDETSGTQTTITTVAKPSITTYQRGHVYSASNEYPVPAKPDDTDAKKNDAIYAQVMQDGTLVTTLSTENSFFYKITGNPGTTYSAQPGDWPTGYYTDAACTTAASGTFSTSTTYYKSCTEADVMDALNIRTSGDATTVVGRNGITLTPATAVYTVTQIPGEDGNWITKYGSGNTAIAAGMVAKLSPDAAGTYAFVYYTGTDEADTDINTAVKLTGDTAPTGWPTGYYTDEACTTAAPSTYAAGTYYQKYTDLNKVYGVKVIKVVSGS